ncbi:carbohydrate ABC transporter permease [Herbaspirillum sp. NPDC087042]|uniref:carbohydrate ABC transporter permease n=1 Tax=Herbaspirillum sp. NPDC087042 TaxID=3364004 RepID=UPI003807FE29
MTRSNLSSAAGRVARMPATSPSPIRRRETQAAITFLLPSFVGFVVFLLFPIAASLWMSFTDWNLLAEPNFVGVQNFVRLLTADPAFSTVLVNTLAFTVEYLVLNLVISMVLALWISSLKRGKTVFRVIFFIPTFAPAIAVSMVWMLMMSPDGLVDYVSHLVHLDVPNLLLSENLAMQAIVIVTLWANVGYNLLLFNAALDLVPPSYLEAARIDGANAWQRLWGVRIPLISPTIFFATVMTAITALQVFDQIFVMTRGGPGASTQTLGFAIYTNGFQNYEMGYASALAWVMFVIIMALTGFQFWLQRKWVHYDA